MQVEPIPVAAEAAPAPRPYGVLGLVVSAIVILALTIMLALMSVGAVALADILINGREHFAAAITAAGDALASGDRARIVTPAMAIGVIIYLSAVIAMLAVARLRGGRSWRRLLALERFSAGIGRAHV